LFKNFKISGTCFCKIVGIKANSITNDKKKLNRIRGNAHANIYKDRECSEEGKNESDILVDCWTAISREHREVWTIAL